MPPSDLVREQLSYDPDTGIFRWLIRPAIRIMIGDQAGHVCGDGYRKIKVCGIGYPAHRLAFLLMTGREPEELIDHINGERGDNRWRNLREATYAENAQVEICKKRTRATSRFRGVSRLTPNARAKPGDKWQVQITVDGKSHFLGKFACEEEAAVAYRDARKRLHRLKTCTTQCA